MSSKIQAALSWILTLAAVAIAGVLIHREFFVEQASARPTHATHASYIPTWQAIKAASIPLTDTAGTMKLFVFSDLECPVCRSFERVVADFQKQHPQDVTRYFVHLPLSAIHRFARPAARAAECADRSGRFYEFISAVYAKQDSLGLRSWSAFATDAGVPDTTDFLKCVAETKAVSRIEAGVALSKQLLIDGTPTVVVNGWRLPTMPDEQELARILTAIKAGKPPFDAANR